MLSNVYNIMVISLDFITSLPALSDISIQLRWIFIPRKSLCPLKL